MSDYKPTYWNGKGKYQNAYNKLWAILNVPDVGPAPTADGNKLVRASDQYYQRLNNGMGRLPIAELDRRMDVLIKELADKYIGGLS